MSNMLDALKRIESKTTGAQGEKGDLPSAIQQTAQRAADRQREAAELESKSRAQGSVDQASELAQPPTVTDNGLARLLGGPRSKAAERAYLELTRRVMGQLEEYREAAILFTSPGDGEGKTSAVTGLARVLAGQDSGDVLVVDGNFRRPGLADWMAIQTDGDLMEVLSGKAEWSQAVRPTGINGLSILPSAADPSADISPVDNANLANLLHDLRRHFRFVLFDGASLRYPEMGEIARHFDGIYLVLELNRTSQSEAKQAVRIIDHCQGRLLGCVLTNDVGGEAY